MRVGIVGHEAAKFSDLARQRAWVIIQGLLNPGDVVVSGGCHLGGVDIWAEQIGRQHGAEPIIHRPARLTWDPEPGVVGFKARNISIATDSDIVHVIVVKTLPPTYTGMKFEKCYHCHTSAHVKSGGCWTGQYAMKMGKPAIWWEIEQE